MVNIVIDSGNLKQGNSGVVTGEIYIEHNNEYFPEKSWNDFPVIILGWWVNEFLIFLKQKLNMFEFCFMDGPFSIVGVIEQNELIAIYFWDKHIEYNEKKFLGYANKADIQKMLLKACRKLFRQTTLSGISCDKLIGLRKFFNELKDIQLLDNHGC